MNSRKHTFVACSVMAALAIGAGAAHAASVTDTFDDPSTLDNWYTDRYTPQVVEIVEFDGENVLHLGLREEGQQGKRGGSKDTDHNNYQGMKLDTPYNGVGGFVSADLYVSSDWQADGIRAGLWATMRGGPADAFPIIEYATGETGHSGGFRWWQSGGYGWTTIGEVETDQWYTLRISLTATEVLFDITQTSTNVSIFSGSVANQGAKSIDNLILQGHNEGRAGEYDIYWDNVTTAVPTPAAAGAGLALMGLMGLRRGRRQASLANVA